MMKTKLTCIILILLSFQISMAQVSKPLKVGEEILKEFESAHPYAGSNSKSYEIVSSQKIFEHGASYIAVHFQEFKLAADDFLVIRNPENTRSWKYSLGEESREKFWSIHIYGEEAIIEIYSRTLNGGYGYKINKIAKGLENININYNFEPEALCGPDDSKEAVCYQNTEPFAYDRSRAVARLLINGTSACTGWLIGDDGHLMTNEHCVGNATTANNVTVEFMAEAGNCATDCRNWFNCAGNIEAITTNLVRVNSNLDYALLKLPTNVTNQYGFLQLRETGAIQNEQIYIPQHPQAWGKRIALESTDPSDTDGIAKVFSLNEPRCGGTGNDVGYYADTQQGSSGSPVLGYKDNLVVALHHCGSCPNRGIPIQDIINDLGVNIPNNAIAPTPRIIGSNYFCNSEIYSVIDIPSGSTVSWEVTPIGIASLSNTSGSSTTLTKLQDGTIELIAIITTPTQIMTVSEEINIGTQTPVEFIEAWYDPYIKRITLKVENFGAGYSYNWKIEGTTYNNRTNAEKFLFNACPSHLIDIQFKVQAVNSCGSSQWLVGWVDRECNSGDPFIFIMSPNPTKGQLTIQYQNEPNLENKHSYNSNNNALNIVDSLGKVVFEIENVDLVNGETIDISNLNNGVYTVIILKNGEKESKQLIISK